MWNFSTISPLTELIERGISSTVFFAEALHGPGPDLYTQTADRRYWMSVSHMVWPNADRAGTTPPEAGPRLVA